MSKRNRDTMRFATGVGLALGGVALAATALYTEVMTSLVARRRTAATDALMEIATGKPLALPDEAIQAKADALLNTPTETVGVSPSFTINFKMKKTVIIDYSFGI